MYASCLKDFVILCQIVTVTFNSVTKWRISVDSDVISGQEVDGVKIVTVVVLLIAYYFLNDEVGYASHSLNAQPTSFVDSGVKKPTTYLTIS